MMSPKTSTHFRLPGGWFSDGLLAACGLICLIAVAPPALAGGDHLLLDRALATIAANRGDLSIRPDISENPFALSRFRRWVENPIDAPTEAQREALGLFLKAHSPVLWLQGVARLGDVDVASPPPSSGRADFSPPDDLPESVRRAVLLVMSAVVEAEGRLTQLRDTVSPEQMAAFAIHLYPEEAEDVTIPGEDEGLGAALDAAGRVDREAMLIAACSVLESLTAARSLLEADLHRDLASVSIETPAGRVEIGGRGPDVHDRPAALIIDLGGDDVYQGRVASGLQGNCSIVLDLDGDDVYQGEDFTQGCGHWGIGILLDLKGDDLYRSGRYAQGAGLFGVGLLIDGEGEDSYLGARFVQAASAWGWGGLLDLGGEDVYLCRQMGQAYAGVLGAAVLCDLGGNDKYLSGAKAPDPREPDMNQSFAQGFAMGIRDLAGGGLAVLADQWGNDLYQCQYFGQGASYWMGVGVLYDGSGKDTYAARRYAQGAGIHFAVGLFLDAAGDDLTASWGVSQGCGHDYGIGILINEKGNDAYVSSWLSMGASEANGTGIFVDNEGSDGYENSSGMAVGRLIESRRAGGIGLFMDAGGQDRYSGQGSNNGVWGSNRWAVGIDDDAGQPSGLQLLTPTTPSGPEEAAGEQRVAEKRHLATALERSLGLPNPLKIEGLLSVAAHWGLENRIPKDAQEVLLGLNPEETVPAMVDLLGTPDIMARLFMDRFFAIHAYQAIPALVPQTEDPDPVIRARALYQLGRLKDTSGLDACLKAAQDLSWRVRANALRAVGEILDKGRLEALAPIKVALVKALEKDDPTVIVHYLEEHDLRAAALLSVIARATPLDYEIYRQFMATPSGPGEKDAFQKAYARFALPHAAVSAPLVAEWIHAINHSKDIAEALLIHLVDLDPAVRRSAMYALAQLRYRPAMHRIIPMLNDPELWVRDTAVLSLALFDAAAVDPLAAAMAAGTPAFIITGLEVLGRIETEKSRGIIEGYSTDPDEGVRRAVELALRNFKKEE
jgi:HEAT repeat protein